MSKSSHAPVSYPYFNYGIPPEFIKHGRTGDAGYDVYNKYEYPITIYPGQTLHIDLGFGIKMPKGKGLFISIRGGHRLKGLTASHAPIDSNYTGEIKALVTNHGTDNVTIQPFERFGQFVILDVTDNVSWVESDPSKYHTNRGDAWGNSSGLFSNDLPQPKN